jgi:hypothetical protein
MLERFFKMTQIGISLWKFTRAIVNHNVFKFKYANCYLKRKQTAISSSYYFNSERSQRYIKLLKFKFKRRWERVIFRKLNLWNDRISKDLTRNEKQIKLWILLLCRNLTENNKNLCPCKIAWINIYDFESVQKKLSS